MREIDDIRALERQILAIQAGAAAADSIDAMDRAWLAAHASHRRNAAIRLALRRLFRLPLTLWRRIRSVAIPPVEETSAGLRGR
ncbi:MAG TPA: hypothetical protein PKA13_06320 [Geminicoccaceae bacterium]|nr:hypothetical protein [Geminicoccus sp.]HMU49371.1 hypothetical protein [Geminicoccaceae bacterium]